jgi:hypothetical protein
MVFSHGFMKLIGIKNNGYRLTSTHIDNSQRIFDILLGHSKECIAVQKWILAPPITTKNVYLLYYQHIL